MSSAIKVEQIESAVKLLPAFTPKPHVPRIWHKQLVVVCPGCGRTRKGPGVRRAISCSRCGGAL